MRHLKPLSVLCLVVAALVAVWFKKGQVLAAGESGVPFLNYSRLLPRTFYAWTEAAIGNYSNHASFFFLGFIQIFSRFLPPFLVQALFYYLVLVVASFSLYFLSYRVFPKRLSALFSALFYILNLFTTVSVINRLQYPFLFFYAILPLALLVFATGLARRQLHLAIVFGLVTAPFSLAFASLPFLALFWLALFLAAAFYIFFYPPRAFPLLFFLTSFLFWLLFHAWWLVPLFISTFTIAFPTAEAVTAFGNVHAFSSLSNLVGGLPAVLRLMDTSFFGAVQKTWGWFPTTWLFQAFALLPAALAVSVGFIKIRSRLLWFFLFLYLVSIFWTKGSSPPLGEVSLWLLSHFRPLEVFRNAFEKIGFLQLLTQSVLIGPALLLVGTKTSKYASLALALVILVVLPYPMWTGQVLAGDEVIVPDFYQQANSWLNSRPGQFRTITFPLSGEGMTYAWPAGYTGVEVSSELFDRPVISMSTAVPYLDNITAALNRSLVADIDRLPALLSWLNSDLVLVRDDILYQRRQILNPQVAADILEKSADFSLLSTFGSLKFYQLLPPVLPLFFSPTTLSSSFPRTLFSDGLLLSSPSTLIEYDPDLPVKQTIVKASLDASLPAISTAGVDQILAVLPTVKHSPSSFLYPAVLAKETLSRLSVSPETEAQVRYDLELLGKRAKEVYLAATTHDPRLNLAADQYRRLFDSRFLSAAGRLRLKSLSPSLVQNTLSTHLALFEASELSLLAEYLRRQLENLGLQPSHVPDLTLSSLPRRLLRFSVPDSGRYTLVLQSADFPSNFTPPDPFQFQLDNLVHTAPRIDFSLPRVSLGAFDLAKGVHELQIPQPVAQKLISTTTTQILTSSGPELNFDLPSFSQFAVYDISLDYLVVKGDGFELQLIHDNDLPEINSFYRRRINADSYHHSWQNFTLEYVPSSQAASVRLVLTAPPFNFCPSPKLAILDHCRDKTYRSRFDKPTEVAIKNLTVTRRFTNSIFLEKIDSSRSPIPVPDITFTRIHPARYDVTVKNASQPFLLVFSQLFNPDWRLSDSSARHLLVNGYANGWWITKTGNFDLTVTFAPQTWLSMSRSISILAVGLGLLLLLIKYVRSNS